MVRIALLSLLFAAFALALVQPSEAGTAEAPEIQDAANDQQLFGEVDQEACGSPAGTACLGSRIDYITVYIADETATDFKVYMLLSNVPAGALTATSTWDFHATLEGGTEVVSTASGAGGENANPPPVAGANTAAAAVDGNTLIFTILKSVYGSPAAGAKLTNIFVTGTSTAPLPVPGATIATDRAPNEGGAEYVFTGGGGTPTVPGDTDGDGLNDTCEQQFFGGLNATNNATADPDGDGLTNAQECNSNPRTDPTKKDTDGDGVDDKKDPFPTDPTKGGTTSGSNSGSKSDSGSKSGTSSGSGSSTGSQSGTGTDDDKVDSLDEAVERLRSDAGYLGTSGAGLLTVVILAILALAVRWSL